MKQSRTVSNNSVTFPIFPQIVAWTDGYMVYDNKTTIINVTVNSLFWTARPAHTLASWDETLKSDHISEPYLALLTTMLFVQHRVSFTLRPVCVKIEITTTLHFSVKDKTSPHTPFSFTVRLISSSRMRVIFIFCGSSPGYLQNLKEIVLCDSNWMSTKSDTNNEMNRDVFWVWNHLRSLLAPTLQDLATTEPCIPDINASVQNLIWQNLRCTPPGTEIVK